MSEEEQENLQASAHGGANVLQHGIFTSKDAAAQYTVQINPENGKYFIYFPKADNMFAELLVAGYQKFMENDFWGLSKSAELGKELSIKYGSADSPMPIHFDVYSRGGLTKGSELESLSKTHQGQLPNLTVNAVGSAYSPVELDDMLIDLQGRNNMPPEVAKTKELYYQVHADDGVAIQIGGAVATPGGTRYGDNSRLQEWLYMPNGIATVHSCYGEGNPHCDNRRYWENSTLKKTTETGAVVGIPQWMPASYMREKLQEKKDEK